MSSQTQGEQEMNSKWQKMQENNFSLVHILMNGFP